MSFYADLAQLEGVIAAGEYSYRGDRYHYKGQLDDEMARMASIMCRATTMSARMQSDILCTIFEDDGCPIGESRGWIVRGPQFSVCVMANVFCFTTNHSGVLNDVFARMRDKLMNATTII
jgi:roadblock/LC7 domain-containing protein